MATFRVKMATFRVEKSSGISNQMSVRVPLSEVLRIQLVRPDAANGYPACDGELVFAQGEEE